MAELPDKNIVAGVAGGADGGDAMGLKPGVCQLTKLVLMDIVRRPVELEVWVCEVDEEKEDDTKRKGHGTQAEPYGGLKYAIEQEQAYIDDAIPDVDVEDYVLSKDDRTAPGTLLRRMKKLAVWGRMEEAIYCRALAEAYKKHQAGD